MRRLPVVDRGNGWWLQHVIASSPRTHTQRRWEVTWRSHRWRCCPSQQVHVIDGTKAPVQDWHPDQDGSITPHTVQCRGCGTLRTARVTIREVTAWPGM